MTCCASTNTTPEAKYADATGAPCGKQTVGLLRRRHICIDGFIYIGKESNKLEAVEEQTLTDPTAAYTVYLDPGRDEWETKILPKLKRLPMPELMKRTGLSRRALQAIRAGKKPNRRNQDRLKQAMARIVDDYANL